MLDLEFHDLAPGTDYTVTARFAIAASDRGRHSTPGDAVLTVTTLAGPAAREPSSPDPVTTPTDDPADAASAAGDADAVDAEPTSATSPVLPIVAIALILLMAAAVTTLLVLRSRRTIG
jgi:hypothetical protein